MKKTLEVNYHDFYTSDHDENEGSLTMMAESQISKPNYYTLASNNSAESISSAENC
jgi:hypothetical protein